MISLKKFWEFLHFFRSHCVGAKWFFVFSFWLQNIFWTFLFCLSNRSTFLRIESRAKTGFLTNSFVIGWSKIPLFVYGLHTDCIRVDEVCLPYMIRIWSVYWTFLDKTCANGEKCPKCRTHTFYIPYIVKFGRIYYVYKTYTKRILDKKSEPILRKMCENGAKWTFFDKNVQNGVRIRFIYRIRDPETSIFTRILSVYNPVCNPYIGHFWTKMCKKSAIGVKWTFSKKMSKVPYVYVLYTVY